MRSSRVILLLLAACACTQLSGCGNDDDKAEKSDRDGKPKAKATRLVAHQYAVQQLDQTLDLLAQDNELQRVRIETMRTQVANLQKDLDKIQEGLLPPGETSATVIAAYKQNRAERADDVDEGREKSGNGVLTTLLMLVGLALIVTYFGKLYRDRQRVDDFDVGGTFEQRGSPTPQAEPRRESTFQVRPPAEHQPGSVVEPVEDRDPEDRPPSA